MDKRKPIRVRGRAIIALLLAGMSALAAAAPAQAVMKDKAPITVQHIHTTGLRRLAPGLRPLLPAAEQRVAYAYKHPSVRRRYLAGLRQYDQWYDEIHRGGKVHAFITGPDQPISATDIFALFVCAATNPDQNARAFCAQALVNISDELGNVTAPQAADARASGCASAAYRWQHLTVLGIEIAKVQVNQSAWCWRGNEITNGGSSYATYSTWGPVCDASHAFIRGWDVYPTWIHSGGRIRAGVSYVFGCAGLRNVHAVIRIHARGWDHFNDMGNF